MIEKQSVHLILGPWLNLSKQLITAIYWRKSINLKLYFTNIHHDVYNPKSLILQFITFATEKRYVWIIKKYVTFYFEVESIPNSNVSTEIQEIFWACIMNNLITKSCSSLQIKLEINNMTPWRRITQRCKANSSLVLKGNKVPHLINLQQN